MSMQELEVEARKRKPTPVRGRDLAAAWLAAVAIIAALFLLVPRGTEHPLADPASIVIRPTEDSVPDGIGETHHGIETCSTRDWADELC